MSSSSDRNIITDIIKNERPAVVAEIGIWQCRLTKCLLKECGDIITNYWAVDPWKEIKDVNKDYERDMDRYVSMTEESWDNAYFKACKLMRYFTQLHVIRADSIVASKIFPKDHFDLVFIDADHRYDFVLADIKAWTPLVKKGGLVTGHDYKIQHKGTMRAVDECFGRDVNIIENSSIWVYRK